jgi:hypothetical protein
VNIERPVQAHSRDCPGIKAAIPAIVAFNPGPDPESGLLGLLLRWLGGLEDRRRLGRRQRLSLWLWRYKGKGRVARDILLRQQKTPSKAGLDRVATRPFQKHPGRFLHISSSRHQCSLAIFLGITHVHQVLQVGE